MDIAFRMFVERKIEPVSVGESVTVHAMMTFCTYYAGGFIWGSEQGRDYTKELLRMKEMILEYVAPGE